MLSECTLLMFRLTQDSHHVPGQANGMALAVVVCPGNTSRQANASPRQSALPRYGAPVHVGLFPSSHQWLQKICQANRRRSRPLQEQSVATWQGGNTGND